MSLDPSVQAQIDSGQFVGLDLIRFDLPGLTVGYHRGGRPYTYNGLTYKPNRWLDPGTSRGSTGTGVSVRTVRFSGVPADPDDAINQIEALNYLNAPVIITVLAGVPESNAVLGILYSTIYEIKDARFEKSAMDQAGQRSLNIVIDLEPPGRTARGATNIRRSMAEHQFDTDATDTCLEYASEVETVPKKWGQFFR